MSDIRNRFKDASWYPIDTPIVIGGAGGIGSWTSFLLGRTGANIYLYDFDRVEAHNIGGQLFSIKNIGEFKTIACKLMANDYSENSFDVFNVPYDKSSLTSPIMIGAFDNMKARKVFFENWKAEMEQSLFKSQYLLVDGRLIAESLQIFCVNSQNYGEYEGKYLFDDSEVPDQPCTFQQTSHCAAIIGGFITGLVTNHVFNVKKGRLIRKVPFFTEFNIPMFRLSLSDTEVEKIITDD